ncbi:hypothetical protein ACFY5C_11700 [Streptomyces sp. NPDC012935]|uniref:hypothetical protein n=1 Tax=Streptomyces sp. NPDC012935 TaxID=3364857 RepID=UPI0036C91B3F
MTRRVRVRARMTAGRRSRRAPTPDSEVSTSRGELRRDWTKIAAASGVFFAAAGLIFTGIGTFYGVLIADDQLEQSEEDAEAQKRKQASMVTMWGQKYCLGGHCTDVVGNRSWDAISNSEMYFEYYDKVYTFTISIPPCTQVDFYRSVSEQVVPEGAEDEGSPTPLGLSFTDAKGVYWVRSSMGDLEYGEDARRLLKELIGRKPSGHRGRKGLNDLAKYTGMKQCGIN